MRGTSANDPTLRPICCICGNIYKDIGHNAWPIVMEGRCCEDCNHNKVIPARVDRMHNAKDRGAEIHNLHTKGMP
jgi:hypothetical protein